MILRALRCRLSSDADAPLAVAWWSGRSADLDQPNAAGAYVVTESTLTALRGQASMVNFRGRKHDARSLAAILIRQPRVPIVQAPFKSSRQVSNSLRTLLEHAARRGESKAYVIGVPPKAFEEMAARVPPPGSSTLIAGGAPESDAARDLELQDPEEIPVELEETLVGHSPEMQIARLQIVHAAAADVPVLVQGDTGTGKEVVARWIHRINPARAHQPFVPVNCGAIPIDLFEAHVFGYVPGAFTDALRQGSEGLWRSAEGGTIFLDEIGDLAPLNQVKLLRVLQERCIRPVGSKDDVPVDARVIAATNRDLYTMKEEGEFREDLYYRLASMVINLPTLRDRPRDVVTLANLFWSEVAPNRPPLSPDVLQELSTYRLRGNARELRYIVSSLHYTFPKSVPDVERLRAVVRMRVSSAGAPAATGPEDAVGKLNRLRLLRRAAASIDACQRLATGALRTSLDADGHARAMTEVGSCLMELQLLGTRADRFEKQATYDVLHDLAGTIASLQSRLARHDPGAAKFCRQDVTKAAAAARAVVRREEARLLESL